MQTGWHSRIYLYYSIVTIFLFKYVEIGKTNPTEMSQ